MALGSHTTYKKRQKELARLEKRREKAAKRLQRKPEKRPADSADTREAGVAVSVPE